MNDHLPSYRAMSFTATSSFAIGTTSGPYETRTRDLPLDRRALQPTELTVRALAGCCRPTRVGRSRRASPLYHTCYPAARMTAEEVKDALRKRHGCETGKGEWVCIEEAFSGWSSFGGGIDLLAIGAWRSAKAPGLSNCGKVRQFDTRNPLVAYEVKVSRADMRRELYGYTPGPKTKWRTRAVLPWPGKAYFAIDRTNYFMFAVPAGMLSDEEIKRRVPTDAKRNNLFVPKGVGLVEVTGAGCRVRVPAAPKNARPLNSAEIGELIRHAVDPNQLRKARELCSIQTRDIERLMNTVSSLRDENDELRARLESVSRLRGM